MSRLKTARRATIRDVASEAQVSISTVSLFVQGGAGVSLETSRRIATAIQKLGYVPRTRIQAPQRPKFFGIFMEELSAPAFPQAVYGAEVRGLELCARQHGYNIVFASVEEDVLPAAVADNHISGAILLGGCPANDKLALKLHEQAFPVVLLDTFIPGVAIDSVLPDNELGGYLALRHLAQLGHKRIAIIRGPLKYRTLTDRLWGALRAADELGINIPTEYLQPSISSGFANKGYREMKELLSLPHPPTAVFAVSDRSAFGALEAIKEVGLGVPDDVALVGFDNEVWAEHAKPPLTTVRYAAHEMGVLAMKRLLERIETNSPAAQRINVQTELVIRQSCGALRPGNAG